MQLRGEDTCLASSTATMLTIVSVGLGGHFRARRSLGTK